MTDAGKPPCLALQAVFSRPWLVIPGQVSVEMTLPTHATEEDAVENILKKNPVCV